MRAVYNLGGLQSRVIQQHDVGRNCTVFVDERKADVHATYSQEPALRRGPGSGRPETFVPRITIQSRIRGRFGYRHLRGDPLLLLLPGLDERSSRDIHQFHCSNLSTLVEKDAGVKHSRPPLKETSVSRSNVQIMTLLGPGYSLTLLHHMFCEDSAVTRN